MFTVAGLKTSAHSYLQPGGTAVHEMGTVRMGLIRDLRLNSNNQMHDSEKCLYHRWQLHDLFRHRQPLADLYGAHRPRLRFCFHRT